ncbi:hypothetical protein L6164_014039 [Bauhinia variegata]|uniref:Uncharacterized protein n=1 Tax=Bauhinia variegata TaxID=167791 RepID=A0ACB9NGA4_BAUVA|nr:hypothetical protein L6164_014039 [Bauhinia variegata]
MKRPSSLGGAFLEVILTVSFPGGGRSKIVSRIQKLRKEVALEPTDIVEVYFESLDNDKSICERVLHSQSLSQKHQKEKNKIKPENFNGRKKGYKNVELESNFFQDKEKLQTCSLYDLHYMYFMMNCIAGMPLVLHCFHILQCRLMQ